MILHAALLLSIILNVSCKSSVLLSQSARQISRQLLDSAKRDIEPSLRWAAIQIEALVPVTLATNDDSGSWSLPSDKSIIDNESTDETAVRDTNIRPEIIRALSALGKSVINSLKPGLSAAVIHLLKNHTSNSLTKDQLFSKEELAYFITDLSEIWSSSLKNAIQNWSEGQLDHFLGFVKRALSSIGHEILKRLGFAAGFMNIDRKHGRMNSAKNVDLYENIKETSHKVATASLTFLHGSGWMSKQLFNALPQHPVQIEDDWKQEWDNTVWQMWDL